MNRIASAFGLGTASSGGTAADGEAAPSTPDEDVVGVEQDALSPALLSELLTLFPQASVALSLEAVCSRYDGDTGVLRVAARCATNTPLAVVTSFNQLLISKLPMHAQHREAGELEGYLRIRKNSVQEAAAQYKSTLAWRAQFPAPTITDVAPFMRSGALPAHVNVRDW
jgi:hypothetical protein